MTTEREALIRVKTERADQHIHDLDAKISEFWRDYPYGIYAEDDPNTGAREFKVRISRPFPIDWAAIIGDAVHNLRSALDHLVCRLIESNGGTDLRERGFPIVDSAAKLKSELPGKVNGVIGDVRKIIKTMKPYQGGNDGYWRLHKLDIDDKHRLITPVASNYRSFGIDPAVLFNKIRPPEMPAFTPGENVAFFKVADNLCPLKSGDTVLRIEPAARSGPQDGEEHQFRFDVAFGESSVAKCEPVLPTLAELSSLVDETIKLLAPYLR